jgi:hypothetical protein
MMTKSYIPFDKIEPETVSFALGQDRNQKPTIRMFHTADARELAMVTPACVTNWPRVNGDGNYGTMWGPTDRLKAKFTLDFTDAPITEGPNSRFDEWASMLTTVDDRLLDFVQANQLKILGRKNLSRDEIKMLQIRSVRPKYDKGTGALCGHNVQMSASKFMPDGCGGKTVRTINVCDLNGTVLPTGTVQPGDVVAATAYANQVYTGVGGDKFGIHWSFEDVQVVCQRTKLATKTAVPCFLESQYEFAQPYQVLDYSAQFSEPMPA